MLFVYNVFFLLVKTCFYVLEIIVAIFYLFEAVVASIDFDGNIFNHF